MSNAAHDQEFCPTCGSALAYDKSGHILYGGRLSYRDFEQILLSLGASSSDVRRLWPEEVERPAAQDRAEGWMRTAQTSDREVAWLRKALGIKSTEESCAIRDAFARAEAEGPIPWGDIEKLTISAFRGALWLERVWRESSQMWEHRCNQATRELADAGLLAKPPQPVLDALAEWLEHERPDGVEVSSEQVDRNVRWSVVRQWFEAAGGTL